MGKTNRRRFSAAPGLLRCSVCRCDLPQDAFPTITVRDKRCKEGHSWTGPAWECRECRKEQRREWRRRKSEKAGKGFVPRGDRKEWEAKMRSVWMGRRFGRLTVVSYDNKAAILCICDCGRETRRHRKSLTQGQTKSCGCLRDEIAAERARVRVERIQSTILHCSTCGETKDRTEFYEAFETTCKACHLADCQRRFQRDKEALSDRYVKRMLTKYTGVPARAIPPAMIEAKRVQLMIERSVPTEVELAISFVRTQLRGREMGAEQLNRLAKAAGFSRGTMQHARRKAGCIYNADTTTWRMG